MAYESPELDIRWFEIEDICKNSNGIGDSNTGDGVVDDDWLEDEW